MVSSRLQATSYKEHTGSQMELKLIKRGIDSARYGSTGTCDWPAPVLVCLPTAPAAIVSLVLRLQVLSKVIKMML